MENEKERKERRKGGRDPSVSLNYFDVQSL